MTDLLTKESAPAGEDDVRQYLSEIRQYPLLTPEEELALAKRCADGDEEAICQMVNSNLRLVVSVARGYAGRGIPLLDLIQEGSIGLLEAAKKFDYTKECRFSTYATKWIRQGVMRYLVDHSSLIRVPAHTAKPIRHVISMRSQLLQQNGAEPTEAELAKACEISVERLRELIALHPEISSLDVTVGDEENPVVSAMEDANAVKPYETLVREELKRIMDSLMDMLNDRQREILQLHFGMTDGIFHSLDEIGKTLGISGERARQIERQAIDKLQKMGASMGLEDFLT